MKVNVFDKYGETIGYRIDLENVFKTYHPENEDCIKNSLENQGEAVLTCRDRHDMFRLKLCEREGLQNDEIRETLEG